MSLNLKKYFGTDGIRTEAGKFPLTKNFIVKLGFCAGKVLGKSHNRKKVVIGQDTRESGSWIFEALASGFCSAGFVVDYAHILPTPCLSLITRDLGYSCGVMISASHNPYYDNGIKFFSASGEKLSDKIELEIESLIESSQNINYQENIYNSIDFYDFYLNICKKTSVQILKD